MCLFRVFLRMLRNCMEKVNKSLIMNSWHKKAAVNTHIYYKSFANQTLVSVGLVDFIQNFMVINNLQNFIKMSLFHCANKKEYRCKFYVCFNEMSHFEKIKLH